MGLSVFHKMCVAVMKIFYCKQKPSIITYRKIESFPNDLFMKDLQKCLIKSEHFDKSSSNLFKETVKNTQLINIRSKITLVEGDKFVSQDAEVAKAFNKYFINIPILKMPNNQSVSNLTSSSKENTAAGIIERYKDHASIKLIKSKNSCLANIFSFMSVSIEEVKRLIKCLDPKKAEQEKDIQIDIKIQNSDIVLYFMRRKISVLPSPF